MLKEKYMKEVRKRPRTGAVRENSGDQDLAGGEYGGDGDG